MLVACSRLQTGCWLLLRFLVRCVLFLACWLFVDGCCLLFVVCSGYCRCLVGYCSLLASCCILLVLGYRYIAVCRCALFFFVACVVCRAVFVVRCLLFVVCDRCSCLFVRCLLCVVCCRLQLVYLLFVVRCIV